MRTDAPARSPQPLRLSTVLVLVTVLLLAATVAPATIADPRAPGGPARDPQAVSTEAVRRADDLREAVGKGSLAEAVGQLLQEHPSEVPDLSRTVPVHVKGLSALPPDQRAPVAELTTAVQAAADALGTLDPADVLKAIEAISENLQGAVQTSVIEPGVTPGAQIPRFGDPAGTITTTGPLAAPPLPPAVDRAARLAPQAASLIASALDRALPRLVASSRTRAVRGERVAGCDLVDQPPLLCVGSEADNRYTKDVALLIDLGGHDDYQMSAGGAPFIGPNGLAVPVSVNVDLGGNDRYVTGTLLDVPSWTGGAFGGAGAGLPGGVGIAVDLGGDDVYTSVGTPLRQAHLGSYLVAQGAAMGGAGILVDEGRNLAAGDRYTASTPGGTDDLAVIVAQGAMISTGMGLLIDRGDGPSDAFVVDGGVVEKTDLTASVGRYVYAQATANGGSAALYDEGSADLLATVGSHFVPTDAQGVPDFGGHPDWLAVAPRLFLGGQGLAQGGLALLLGGDDATTYTMSATGDGIADMLAFGQGAGNVGLGILDDAGGADTYQARAVREHVQDILVNDERKCPSPSRCEAWADVDHTFAAAPFLLSQGAAFAGTGVLRDRGVGDDAYEAESHVGISVTLRDELPKPSAPPVLSVSSSNHQPQLVAQGAGDIGTGVLLDEGGTDSYDARYLKETEASATSLNAAGEPRAEAVNRFRIRVGAQGGATNFGSQGAILDQGGAGDRFMASGLLRASTSPNPNGAINHSGFWPSFQGGGYQTSGVGTFEARGENPVIVSSPSQPICFASTGWRGFGDWAECWGETIEPVTDPEHSGVDTFGRAVGRAPGATGRAPSLTITEETPETPAGERLDVAVVLRDPDGQPMPGAEIHVDLQYGLCVMNQCAAMPHDNPAGVQGQWLSGYTVDGVTDEDGVARVRLPLDNTDVTPSDWRWRVFATYDGAPGLLPRHAAKMLDLGP